MSNDAQQRGQAAVVLLSGGLDSATCLAIARQAGFRCITLAVDYGQRHRVELDAAGQASAILGAVEHRVVRVDLRVVGGSALTEDIEVPTYDADADDGIPVTYVPARNTLLLSLGLGLAEVVGAQDLFIGVNAVDYSGYPDCRPEFIAGFEQLAGYATKAGINGRPLQIHTPLIELSKAGIIRRGLDLGVDYARTVSCYNPADCGAACGRCDACEFRRKGFREAGVTDPTRYV